MRHTTLAALLLLASAAFGCGGDDEREAPPGCQFTTTEFDEVCYHNVDTGVPQKPGVKTTKVERLCCTSASGTSCETTGIYEGRCIKS